jgi:hypothetical protein
MKPRTRILLIILLLFSAAAHADEASKRAKVRELFVLNQMEDRIQRQKENAAAQSREMERQLTEGLELNSQQEKLVLVCYEKINQTLAATLNWSKLEPAYEDVYAQTYTEEELDGVLAFYKSPAGKAYMAKTPIITDKTIAISNDAFAAVLPKIKALLADLLESLKESGVHLKPA